MFCSKELQELIVAVVILVKHHNLFAYNVDFLCVFKVLIN